MQSSKSKKSELHRLSSSEESIFTRIKFIIINYYNYVSATFYYFRKEKFFNYLLIVVILMCFMTASFIILEPARLKASLPNPDSPNFLDKVVASMYWAIVTIATIGYGDISPGTTTGRIMVIIGIYLSLATITLFTANLTSTMTTMKIREGRGFMNLFNLKNHLVICGWKKDMFKLLEEIFISNPKLNKSDVVVIANIGSDIIELFRQQYPEFSEINILRGEHYNETILKNANLKMASKVMILADESTDASDTEKDSKTVMTAMTVNTIAKDSRISAELLDRKFESYLRNAHVDEIIYTSDYGKSLIAKTVLQVGVVKVINDLLDVRTPALISTRNIPEEYHGKTFDELASYFKKFDNSIVIGLVENVGSYMERKREALKEAQKTPDISKLVSNLQMAKIMENNMPNLNPGADYIIKTNSMVILIERRNLSNMQVITQ